MKINILLIALYESWPEHMLTFFHSVRHNNPLVTFTLFSNLNASHPSWATNLNDIEVPPNVKFVSTSFETIHKQIVDEDRLGLGFKVVVNTPYKLADFSPAYGKLYEVSVALPLWLLFLSSCPSVVFLCRRSLKGIPTGMLFFNLRGSLL